MGVLGHKLTDRIDDADRSLTWYLLRSATRQEKRAEASLIERGFPVYVPRYADARLDKRTWERVRVEMPLFDGYLFSALGPKQALSDFKVEGVCGPVRFGMEQRVRPMSILHVEALVRDEVSGLFDRTLANVIRPLEVGESVRLLEGPLAGFGAQVVKLKSKDRVRLLVSVFGQVSTVTLKANQVERAA